MKLAVSLFAERERRDHRDPEPVVEREIEVNIRPDGPFIPSIITYKGQLFLHQPGEHDRVTGRLAYYLVQNVFLIV